MNFYILCILGLKMYTSIFFNIFEINNFILLKLFFTIFMSVTLIHVNKGNNYDGIIITGG